MYYIYFTYYTDYINYFQVRMELGIADHIWLDKRAAIAQTVMSWVIISSLLCALDGCRTYARHIGSGHFFSENRKLFETFSENPKYFQIFRNYFGFSQNEIFLLRRVRD